MFMLAIVSIIIFSLVVRSFFVLIGAYKDPLLASFEQYGPEHIFSPLLMFFVWSSAFIYVSLYWYISSEIVFSIGLIIAIPLLASFNLIMRLLHKYKDVLRMYPRWCHQLIENTDREERRRIAYMWLFLPPSTRMIYNTNNHLFRQWVEQVLLTVAH